MRTGQGIESAPTADPARPALDYLARLLAGGSSAIDSLATLLEGLRIAFAARAAGLAGPLDGSPAVRERACASDAASPPESWPWQDNPDLPVHAWRRSDALPHADASTSWLLTTTATPLQAGWLLWLEAPQGRSWTDAERGALALAGQVLSRLAATDGEAAPWVSRLERAARQRRLQDASVVAGRLAHDFGNVLTGILGFSELALAQLNASSTPYRYLEESYRAAQRGTELIGLLRLFSRRGATGSGFCAVADVAALEQTRHEKLPAPRPRLAVDVPEELPHIGIDGEHLRQLLAALLDNAREALGQRGQVRLSAREAKLSQADCGELLGAAQPGPHLEVSVTDGGPGFSPEARRRVLGEPFFTTKAKHRGLGLSVVFGIALAHRGGLAVDWPEDGGTRVRVYLPLAPTNSAVPVRPETRAPGETGFRILVVDDDEFVLRFARASLEHAGHRVQAASSAAEALAVYAAPGAPPFQLVISDVVMPEMDGVDLARHLMRLDARVNMLFMSGQVSVEGLRERLPGCPAELLAKPFRADQLLRVVQAALERDVRPLSVAPPTVYRPAVALAAP